MEPLIIDSTPKGSAILAYGTARGPRWNPKLLALLAGSFALIVVIVFGFWYVQTLVELPTDRLLVVALRPVTVDAVLSATLRQDLPAPWRAAIETRSRFPAFIGIALDEQDAPYAFALVARTATVVGGSNLQVQPQGALIFLTDSRTHVMEDVPLHELVSLSRRMRRSQAAWTLRGDLLERMSSFQIDGLGNEEPTEVRGTWDGRLGRIDIKTERTTPATALNAPMFAVLGESRNDASPVLLGLLSQGIDLRTIIQAPHTVSLDPVGDHALALSWGQTLESQDVSLLASARGLRATRELTLPDETVISELRLGQSSGTIMDGGSMLFLGDVASSTFIQPLPVEQPDADCAGTVRLSLEGEALDGVLSAWNTPSSWKEAIHRIKLIEQAKGANICIN